MVQNFSAYIKKERLFSSSDLILLAVSGGVDSVVLCDLFFKEGLKFGIAHCNFQLRGKESNEDELFVKQLAIQYNVPLYCKRFKTTAFAERKNVSVQMAARELRYDWFNEICKTEKYKLIATAHHQDDSIETFFINLIRGTGISGLHGILPKQGNVIRPLLFSGKNQIIQFAFTHKLNYREDSSNSSDKYLRNKIRHQIIPVLKEMNPAIENTILKNIERLKETELVYRTEIDFMRSKIVTAEKGIVYISITKLQKTVSPGTYIYEFLKPYNFNSDTANEIAESLDSESGKQFFSATHRLIKDRKFLIIEERIVRQQLKVREVEMENILEVAESQKEIKFNKLKLSFQILTAEAPISKSPSTAALDYEKLVFPLELRKWKKGDSFCPLGMKGKKKLSDFFIDNKLPLNRKENIWVLISGGKIVWVIGLRIDERFKITNRTKKIFFADLVK